MKTDRRLWHKLVGCPTFWHLRPSFQCPDCGRDYRCYWDGHDCACGTINLCQHCAARHHKYHQKRRRQA
jgi:hypothetical protein